MRDDKLLSLCDYLDDIYLIQVLGDQMMNGNVTRRDMPYGACELDVSQHAAYTSMPQPALFGANKDKVIKGKLTRRLFVFNCQCYCYNIQIEESLPPMPTAVPLASK